MPDLEAKLLPILEQLLEPGETLAGACENGALYQAELHPGMDRVYPAILDSIDRSLHDLND